MASIPVAEALLPTSAMPSPPTGHRSGSWCAYQAAAWPTSSSARGRSPVRLSTEPSARRGTSPRGWAGCGAARSRTEREIALRPGTALTIPVGTAFQFRNTGREPLAAVGVTMPPWPGEGEAMEVAGAWAPQLTAE